MWYLQLDTLAILAAFCLGIALFRLCTKNTKNQLLLWLMPVAEGLILLYISERLAVFYGLYILIGVLCTKILFRFPKKWLFALFSLGSLVPFFLSRSESFGFSLPFLFVSIGIAYQMLKMIDGFYYVYFTQEAVDPLIFVNYMLFLPVFTAGPIFRYREFADACRKPVAMNGGEFTEDCKRLILGMFKKVVLSAIGIRMLQALLKTQLHWYTSVAIALLCYLTLYFDLSGYSDIAVAFGRVAGFAVPENFKSPWKAPSFTQFWRCWHASLSNWIREHIFILLHKKKLNRWASAALCLLTMVVMSLWHGFCWAYFFAGLYNGLLLAAENLLHLTTVNKRKTKKSVFFLRCFGVNALFALNTLVFLMPPEQVLAVLQGFFAR